MLARFSLVFGLSLAASTSSAVPISIVGTNDLHGQVERTAALAGHLAPLRARLAKEKGGVVVVDGGDMFQGTLESNLEEGKAVVQAYNAVGYDAAAIGNHEFDFGPAGDLVTPKAPGDDPRGALKARAAEAKFPFLAANVIDEATSKPVAWPNVRASTSVTRGGVSIGIIGVTTLDTPRTTISSNFKGLTMAPLAETIEREAKALRKSGARVVVVAAHAGGKCAPLPSTLHDQPTRLDSCEADAEIMKVARALPKGLVDVIVAGHTHQAMAHVVNDIVILESWANGRGFGRVDLEVTDKAVSVTKIHPPRRLCGPEANDNAPIEQCTPAGADDAVVVVDQALLAALAPSLVKAKALRSRKLGVVVESEVKRGYDGEGALGNLFADLMREARPDADVSLMNGGGVRANLEKGELTYGAVFQMMPFDNRFAMATMSVAELRFVLEKSLSSTKKGGIFSMAGARATVSCDGAGKARVDLVNDKGVPFKDEQKIKVVTTDFVALGGDGGLAVDESRVVVDEGDPVREHLVRALEKRKRPLRGDDPALYSPASARMKNAKQKAARCEAPSSSSSSPPLVPAPGK
ncbi:MAG: 5'-nucleotidase C-terminal domain-containing protein [Deltaproteobacteria bacterium]|nr:5'-nucleotidase C-terminal domain-containing protein [Deltaproteobacteria bacterium]